MNGSETKTSEERSWEIRIALVLYGGVSLAVYENGVTRAFYDLVKENGPFKLLLKLLDADATVDVVAGASAGGINGLFLAAALESGADFAQTADLWRKHGDLGALLRPVAASDHAISFLDGEGYYQQRLEEAFQSLLTPSSIRKASPGEMDVFITGTNLEGILTSYWDSVGTRIDDKRHRTVFRLQHRPGRKTLGLGPVNPQSRNSRDLQACVLASIARITSTFPVAFPPFSLEQISQDRRDKVKETLERTSRVQPSHHIYVDGGVLDNKPFGPALEAIFYRMPHKLVDRRLFYVEPDPQHLTPLTDEATKRLENPFHVAVASLSTIPSHESISEDLEKLQAHNAKIRWLKNLKANYLRMLRLCGAATELKSSRRESSREVYRKVRIDNLSLSLLSDTDEVPSASTMIPPHRRRLFERLQRCLLYLTKTPALLPEGKKPSAFHSTTEMLSGVSESTSLQPERDAAETPAFKKKAFCSVSFLDPLVPYDVAWHMRCAFHVLYHIYDCLEKEPNREDLLMAMRATGRIIKTLEVIRSALGSVRDRLMELPPQRDETMENSGARTMRALFESLTTFLMPDNEVWNPLAKNVGMAVRKSEDVSFLSWVQDREQGPLGSSILSEVLMQARHWNERRNIQTRWSLPRSSQETILTRVHDILQLVVASVPDAGHPLEDFVVLDEAFYPLEFSSGIHELDEIEYVRISPRDAQIGLSAFTPSHKVTGDDLAHFAAFFRRDWRTNDILWGRIDGICQIIRSLLDPGVQERLWRRRWSLPEVITEESLEACFPECPWQQKEAVMQSWRSLMDTRPSKCFSKTEKLQWIGKLQTFRDQFILAAQCQAVCEDLETLYEDIYFQELVWGTLSDEAGVGPQTGESVLQARARERGAQARQAVQNCGLDLKNMAIGSQTVVGPRGAVPLHILVEYGCQAYLLVWGMIRSVLEGRKHLSSFFARRKPRWMLRTPIVFVYHLVRSQRRQRGSFPFLITGSVAALLASGITGLILGNVWFLLPIAAALAVMAITVWFKPEKK